MEAAGAPLRRRVLHSPHNNRYSCEEEEGGAALLLASPTHRLSNLLASTQSAAYAESTNYAPIVAAPASGVLRHGGQLADNALSLLRVVEPPLPAVSVIVQPTAEPKRDTADNNNILGAGAPRSQGPRLALVPRSDEGAATAGAASTAAAASAAAGAHKGRKAASAAVRSAPCCGRDHDHDLSAAPASAAILSLQLWESAGLLLEGRLDGSGEAETGNELT